MRKLAYLMVAAAAAMMFSAAASAEEKGYKGEYLGLGVGYFDLFQNDGNKAVSLDVNYQYKDIYHGLRPLAGIVVTTDEAAYAYAGAKWDLPVDTYPVIISPSFAVGAYTQGGNGKDLGHGIEFRSGIEVAYEFSEAGDRIGVQLSHISNADLGNHNPGTEILQLNYSMPIGLY